MGGSYSPSGDFTGVVLYNADIVVVHLGED